MNHMEPITTIQPLACKAAATSVAGVAAGCLAPALAPAILCTAMVFIDFATAVALGRRLRRAGRGAEGKLSSARFGRVVATLGRIYGALALAALARFCVVPPDSAFDPVGCVAGAVCFWQLLSILENESTCSDARWARVARRFLIDKARRHLQ